MASVHATDSEEAQRFHEWLLSRTTEAQENVQSWTRWCETFTGGQNTEAVSQAPQQDDGAPS